MNSQVMDETTAYKYWPMEDMQQKHRIDITGARPTWAVILKATHGLRMPLSNLHAIWDPRTVR